MTKKLYSLQEAQKIWSDIVKAKSKELKKELSELKLKKSNIKETKYV